MTKVVKFPQAVPEKLGVQRASKPRVKKADKHGQLNLFSGGKVVQLNQLTPFEDALLCDENGDTAKARTLYLKAVEDKDSIADAYCNLGIIEYIEGNYPKGIDCFTNCLQHNPRHFEAHYNLANLYAEVGDFKLAKFHYQVAIEVEPTFPNSYFNLGLTLAMERNYQEAVQCLISYRAIAGDEDVAQVDNLIKALQRSL